MATPDKMKAAEDLLLLTRGRAIQSYANLEQSLCLVFAALSKTERNVAAVIFFRLNNKSALLAVLERLMKMHHGDTFRTFWHSLEQQLRTIDQRRNEIVHWNGLNIHSQDEDGKKVFRSILRPPSADVFDLSTDEITVPKMEDFIERCSFYQRLANMFALILQKPELKTQPDIAAWLDIFSRPVVYPPPEDHPLSPKHA